MPNKSKPPIDPFLKGITNRSAKTRKAIESWLGPPPAKPCNLADISAAIHEFAEHKRNQGKIEPMAVASAKRSTKAKVEEVEAPKYKKIGQNVMAKRVGDFLFLKIALDVEGTASQSGRAMILAKTEGNRGFADLSTIIGEDMGLNLIASKRIAKKGKKPAARDDDDEDDD